MNNLFQKIQKIEIASSYLAQDIFAGAYRSIFKGQGMEFEDVREYIPGDEVRNIDWNVTARMNHPFVKNFREERDLTMFLVVDTSASCQFGGQVKKSDIIAEIAAVLAFSAIQNNDKVGLLLYSDIVEKYIPPYRNRMHVLRIIRELLAFKPQHTGSNLEIALRYLGNLQLRSSICFLISDFLFPMPTKKIKLLAAKHDLISICITDPEEYNLPNIGLAAFQDMETGKELFLDTSQASSAMKEKVQQQKKAAASIGTDFIEIRTDQSYTSALKQFFKMRKTRQM